MHLPTLLLLLLSTQVFAQHDSSRIYFPGIDKLYIEESIAQAKEDIDSGTMVIYLYCENPGRMCYRGGYIDSFEMKYNLRFIKRRTCSEEINITAYNEVIFQYLDDTYGDIWRKEIPFKVIGL